MIWLAPVIALYLAVIKGSNPPHPPLLPELELLLAIHPVAAIAVGLIL